MLHENNNNFSTVTKEEIDQLLEKIDLLLKEGSLLKDRKKKKVVKG